MEMKSNKVMAVTQFDFTALTGYAERLASLQ